MRILGLLSCFLMITSHIIAQTVSATYTAGNIPTSFGDYNASCNGPNTTLTITLPGGTGVHWVTGIDIEYEMTASNGSWMSDQASQIHFQNNNVTEATVYFGVGNTGGTYSYSRTNVPIANGLYAPNTDLVFEMRAWRFYGAFPFCGTDFNQVDNMSWTITVHYEESCSTGSNILTNQTEVDDFISDHGNCSLVIGALEIDGTNPMNTSGLSFIDYIGSLTIRNYSNSGTATIDGLQNLTSALSVLLVDNESVTDMSGFPSLSDCVTLQIANNTNFINFNGIGPLSTINTLQIIENPDLINFTGLETIESVGILAINNNDGIQDLTGLSGIESMTGGTTIVSNNSLSTLQGLENLNNIESEFLVASNPVLTGFANWTNLDTVIGAFGIDNNAMLSDLSDFSQLRFVGGFSLYSNPSITNLNGLNNLEELSYSFVLDNNTNLTDLTALSNLVSIGGELNFNSNSKLSNLNGLNNLKEIGTLKLTNLDSLSDLSGLSNLISVNEDFIIDNNPSLAAIDSLINLNIIQGNLNIINNPILESIGFVNNLDGIMGQLNISNNALLSNCCPVLNIIPGSVSGFDIQNNLDGCNSYYEVSTTCAAIDPDQDGILTAEDNCPNLHNPNQEDEDSDNIGNACDNCPLVSNPDQADANNNFIGDACEVAPSAVHMEIESQEVFINNEQKGLIMTDPNGDCHRLYIDLDGNLKTVAISCP